MKFSSKNQIFVKKSNFRQKNKVFVKKSNFRQKIKFSLKNQIFVTKIEILVREKKSWSKVEYLVDCLETTVFKILPIFLMKYFTIFKSNILPFYPEKVLL